MFKETSEEVVRVIQKSSIYDMFGMSGSKLDKQEFNYTVVCRPSSGSVEAAEA